MTVHVTNAMSIGCTVFFMMHFGIHLTVSKQWVKSKQFVLRVAVSGGQEPQTPR